MKKVSGTVNLTNQFNGDDKPSNNFLLVQFVSIITLTCQGFFSNVTPGSLLKTDDLCER